MNLKNSLLAAALLGALSTSGLAVTADAHAKVTKAVQFESPTITKIVSPTGLSRNHNKTVVLKIALDEKGQPTDVKILSRGDEALVTSLVPAVQQWQFTPGKKNGVAVPTNVVVPIEIVEA